MACKSSFQIAATFRQRETCLRGSVPGALTALDHDRNIQSFGQNAGNFSRLVEPAFTQSERMQRHRDQEIGQRCMHEMVRQQRAE